MLRLTGAVLLVASVVSELFAADRIEIIAKFGGERVPGVQACFSRAAVDGLNADVLDRLVSGPETRCLPADKVLDLPAGSWHVYLRSANPFLVSTHPTVFHRSAGSTDDADVTRLNSDLVPAAMVDLEEAAKTLSAGQSLALYVTNIGSDVSAPSLVPVSSGITRMPVPARTPVVPLVLRGAEIVAVGNRVSIEKGELAAAVFPQRAKAVVVVPYRFATELHEALPTISFVHRRLGRVIERYKPTANEGRGLLFAEDVERGKLNVTVDGEAITANPIEVSVSSVGAQVVVTEDLVLRAADATASITWTLDDQFANDVRNGTHCANSSTMPAPPPLLRLYQCQDGKEVSRPRQLEHCVLLRETSLSSAHSGTLVWPAPPALTEAILELTYGGISAFERVRFSGTGSGNTHISLMPRYVTGQVTERERPVAAEIGCGGPPQATDVSGYYRCWRPTGGLPIVVVNFCDGSGSYHQRFREDASVVDVRVASNTLTIQVVDATGEPVENAFVTVWEGSPFEVPEPDSTPIGPTGETGEVSDSRLEPRKIAVCADKKEFTRVCQEGIVLEPDGDVSVRLKLRREMVVRGRIASSTEIIGGRLYVMLGAIQLAEAVVERDGSFTVSAQPPAGAAFILASETLPLCVLRSVTADGAIQLSIPPTLVPRSFVVSSQTVHAPITLELGGVLLSSNAFGWHQILRHQQYVVAPGRPITVDAVDAARGITVVVGFVAVAGAPPSDPASLPRYPLTDRATLALP